MDGLKGTVPMGVLKEEYHQMSLFESEVLLFGAVCAIYNPNNPQKSSVG